jgi:hypothetical protein
MTSLGVESIHASVNPSQQQSISSDAGKNSRVALLDSTRTHEQCLADKLSGERAVREHDVVCPSFPQFGRSFRCRDKRVSGGSIARNWSMIVCDSTPSHKIAWGGGLVEAGSESGALKDDVCPYQRFFDQSRLIV